MKNMSLKNKIIIMSVCFIVLCFCIILNPTLAKYTDKIKSNHLQTSSNFYFTSNYLKNESITYQIYTNALDIELYNYDINNINNITNNEIIYTSSIKYYTNEDILLKEDSSSNNSTWTNDDVSKKSVLNINNTENADYIIVTIHSTSPYSKTLTSRFNFNQTNNVPMYSISKLTNGFSVKIMVANENMDNVLINWPSACGPDNTNPYMSSWINNSNSNYVNNLNANTTYVLNFYCALEKTNAVTVSNAVLGTSEITINLE